MVLRNYTKTQKYKGLSWQPENSQRDYDYRRREGNYSQVSKENPLNRVYKAYFDYKKGFNCRPGYYVQSGRWVCDQIFNFKDKNCMYRYG